MESLFPYQKIGARWLASKTFALLADEMGLGKSAQAIAAADYVGAEDVLVICPAVARINWLREFDKFGLYPRGGAAVESKKDEIPATGVVVVSYEMAVSRHAELMARRWDLLVADEAHYLKSRTARRTVAVFGEYARGEDCLAERAERMYCLTGTPAPNNVSELYPILKAGGSWPKGYQDFVQRYCHGYTNDYGFKITGIRKNRVPELKTMLSGYMLRRKKEEVMKDLPPIRMENVALPASKVDEEIYFAEYFNDPAWKKEQLGAQTAALKTALSGDMSIADRLKALDAIYRSTSRLRRYTGMAKVPALVDLITNDMLSGVHKLVVFCVHRDVIETLRTELRKFKPVTLYGGTPPAKRQRNIDKFQNSPKCRLFIGQITAAGSAITLTAAHEVLIAESSWSPAENAQAIMRVHRIGQIEPVRVRFAALADSMDEQVQTIVRRKTLDLAQVFD